MPQPVLSYRLFSFLRQRAYSQAVDEAIDTPGRGLINLDDEIDTSEQLGLSSEDTRAAMEDLMDAELLRRLTPAEQQDAGIHEYDHHVVFVAPLDDLTVATILLGRP